MICKLMGGLGRSLGIALLAALVAAGCGGGSNTCVNVAGGDACDGQADPTQVVSRLSVTLSAASIANTGGETVDVTVVAVNANNQTIEGAPVLLSVDSDAEIAVDGEATDADGSLTGTVRIGENHSNRAITVRATAEDGGVVAEKTFLVTGAELTGTPVPKTIEPAAAGKVTFRLVDAGDNPMSGVEITITGADGTETSATTGTNGEFDFNYTAPSTTGEATIQASAGGTETTVTVLVQPADGGGIPEVDPTDSPIRSASLSANPTVVPTNAEDSTTNFSQLRALFVTDNNSPVENIRVRFELVDTNSVGGTISTGTTLVYSSANGIATASYIAGTRQSPTDGVTLRACWDYADFSASACPNSVTTTLTVVADPVSVSIGTNELIESGASDLTYVKRYIVQVVDSSGVAKAGVTISPSVDLPQYFKGFWSIVGESWVRFPQATCDNEDLNRNNIYEVYADGWDEDANGSLNLTAGRPALEPRKADVALSFESGNQTDATGTVVLRIEYPKDLGSWVQFNIQVAASGVSGTEGRANYSGVLPVPADVVNNTDASPAFVLSPYGIDVGDTVIHTFEGKDYSLCTNPN